MQGLKGKTVVITGASTGIGRGIAVRFWQEGANVVINYHRHPQEAEETQRQCLAAKCLVHGCEGKTLLVQGDVSKEDDVKALFEKSIDAFGTVDVLVNNAGILKEFTDEMMSPVEDYDRIMAVNLRGFYLCSDAAVRHFTGQAKPGVILNISSVHETMPYPNCIPYALSKAAMGNLTKTLALKYASKGIRVNGIGPGAIDTPINEGWMAIPEERQKVESYIPLGRIGKPEEIASLAAFLASDEASYITGQTYYADGGMSVYPEMLKM